MNRDNRGIYLNEKKKIRGVSKAEWLQAAMEVLSQKGVDSLSVEGLARGLGISKSGFSNSNQGNDWSRPQK
jgi:hypothetical protein